MNHRATRARAVVLRDLATAALVVALLPAAADGMAPGSATPHVPAGIAPENAMSAHAAAVAPAGATAPGEVSITGFQFQPAVLTVRAGTRVTWTNRDTTPHTVTSRDARFASSAGMDTNDRHAVVFDRPGTYEYFCSLHPMMVGKVIVEPGG